MENLYFTNDEATETERLTDLSSHSLEVVKLGNEL